MTAEGAPQSLDDLDTGSSPGGEVPEKEADSESYADHLQDPLSETVTQAEPASFLASPSELGSSSGVGDTPGSTGASRRSSRRGSRWDDSVGALDTDSVELGEEPLQRWHSGSLIAQRFRIQQMIGQGGMGRVYLVHDETLDRQIALKRIPQEILFDVDARDDLKEEANRLLDLAHDNIVRVHTYYDGPTWPFFAMELLEGPTLKRLLRERKRGGGVFSADEILEVARQVGSGLSHAHARHIVHRDLKPANLMLARPPVGETLTADDTVKITDFGISRVIADSTLRQTGRRSGTLPYMSPEQYQGKPSTPQSDIYSFACTLYELATGRPPFYTGDIGYQIIHVEPSPLDRALADRQREQAQGGTSSGGAAELASGDEPIERSPLPDALTSGILRGLSKLPEDRFASVDEFVAALEGREVSPGLGVSVRGVKVAKGRVGAAHRPFEGAPSWARLVGATVVTASLCILLFFLLRGPGGEGGELGLRREATNPPTHAGGTGELSAEERLVRRAFAESVRREFERQVGHIIGRDFQSDDNVLDVSIGDGTEAGRGPPEANGPLRGDPLPLRGDSLPLRGDSLPLRGDPVLRQFRVRLSEVDMERGATYLSRLVFVRTRVDSDGQLALLKTRGRGLDGVWTFTFRDIPDGAYDVSAHVERADENGAEPEFSVFANYRLTVDLRPPEFDVVPVEPEGLVDESRAGAGAFGQGEFQDASDPGRTAEDSEGALRFVTFGDSIEYRIVPGFAEDVHLAWEQYVAPGGETTGNKVPIDSRSPQVIKLLPGIENEKVIRVQAVDRAGNVSEPRDLRFVRRRIELSSFEVTRVTGNVAELEGLYRVEGGVLPELVFLVNGEEVEADWAIRSTGGGLGDGEPSAAQRESPREGAIRGEEAADERSSASDDSSWNGDRLRSVPFAALVPLSLPSNIVEVQYRWGESAQGFFGSRGICFQVQMQAPTIHLQLGGVDLESDVPGDGPRTPIYTTQGRVTLFGTLEGWFPGLGLTLFQTVGSGRSGHNREVGLAPAGSTATFSEDIELGRNVENRIRLECYYETPTNRLQLMLEPLVVFSDAVPPSPQIELTEGAEEVLAEIHCAERLQSLRARFRSDLEWQEISTEDVETQGPLYIYSWRFPNPGKPVELLVSASDLAGNPVQVQQMFFPMEASERTSDAVSGRGDPGSSRRPARKKQRVFRAPILWKLDLNFIRCGTGDLEMGVTEVPAAAWHAFRVATGSLSEDAPVPKRGMPMVFGDEPVKRIKQFAKWIGAQADDGYVYSLPTLAEWQMAFVGAETRKQALEQIEDWFRRDFSIGMRERYGRNQSMPVGSRPQNATPTRLLDMESNLQEIVYDERGLEVVIGGHNHLADAEKIQRNCVVSRPFDNDQRGMMRQMTGIRLSRRPVHDDRD